MSKFKDLVCIGESKKEDKRKKKTITKLWKELWRKKKRKGGGMKEEREGRGNKTLENASF